ncbi:MAG: ABC transporter substrate-binding protein [Kineosporiaceae bacterium]
MAVRTWRRGATVLAAGVSAALVLAACAGDDEGDDGGEAGGDLPEGCEAFEDYGSFDGEEVEIYNSIREVEAERFIESFVEFEECTGITVEWNDSGEFEQQLPVRVQGGDAPDLAPIPQPGLLRSLIASGAIPPADEEYEAFARENFPEEWIDFGSVDGQFYAAPLGSNVKSLVWYSPSYFEENGLEVPETWDDLIALTDEVQELMAGDDVSRPWCVGIESGGATGWVVTDWMEDIVLREAGVDVYDQWVTNEIPFDDPQILAAAERAGEILTDPERVNGGHGDVRSITITAFQEGGLPILDDQCALHRQASFYANQWGEDVTVAEDGDVFAFYLPPIDPDQGSPVLVAGEFLAAFNDEPATLAVQRYMASGEYANTKAALGAWVSANEGLDIANVESPIDQLSVEILQDPETVSRFDGSDQMPSEVGAGSFWSEATAWINGDVDAATMIGNIEASWPAS